MIKHYVLLLAFAMFSIHHESAHADLVFDWSFDDSGSTGPITGTISFPINPGDGGTGLAPTSIVITSAPGHSFSGPYVFGTNLIGDTATWNVTHAPATTPWDITTSDVLTTGTARFKYNTAPNHEDYLRLSAVPASTSMLMTGTNDIMPASTSGDATFTAQSVPEASSFLCLGLVGIGIAIWKKLVPGLERSP